MAVATVRPAGLGDVAEIARIQRDTWRTAYAELLPDAVLTAIGQAESELAWHHAVENGPATVHVAVEGGWLVGFCAAGLAPEIEITNADGGLPVDAATTALVSALLVEPRWGRRGHGGRLLAAAVDGLGERGATRGVIWVPEADRVSIGFFANAGWLADGTVRTLDAAGRPLREVRLTGDLEPRPGGNHS